MTTMEVRFVGPEDELQSQDELNLRRLSRLLAPFPPVGFIGLYSSQEPDNQVRMIPVPSACVTGVVSDHLLLK